MGERWGELRAPVFDFGSPSLPSGHTESTQELVLSDLYTTSLETVVSICPHTIRKIQVQPPSA